MAEGIASDEFGAVMVIGVAVNPVGAVVAPEVSVFVSNGHDHGGELKIVVRIILAGGFFVHIHAQSLTAVFKESFEIGKKGRMGSRKARIGFAIHEVEVPLASVLEVV